MRARSQPNLWRAVARHEDGSRTVELHIPRPVFEIAGQADPGLGEQFPPLRETPAMSVQIEDQPFGPLALIHSGIAGLSATDKRAAAKFLALKHPALPGLQIGRHGDVGREQSRRDRQEQHRRPGTHAIWHEVFLLRAPGATLSGRI